MDYQDRLVIILRCDKEQEVGKKEREDRDFLWGAIFFNLSGMLILSFLKRAVLKRLDRGQMWTFSLVTSVVQYVCLVAATDKPAQMLLAHWGINLGLLLAVLFLQFGFHFEIIDQLGDDYFR